VLPSVPYPPILVSLDACRWVFEEAVKHPFEGAVRPSAAVVELHFVYWAIAFCLLDSPDEFHEVVLLMGESFVCSTWGGATGLE